MFVHSVKVPQLYKIAAKQLKRVKEDGESLKKVIYSEKKFRDIKRVYGLVFKTVTNFSQIEAIIEQSKLFEKEERLDPWLTRILITELLWSNKTLGGESKPVKTILSHRALLEKCKAQVESNTPQRTVEKVKKPRYARINTLAITVEEAVNNFLDEGERLVRFTGSNYEDFVSKIAALEEDEFMVDFHIKELLVFPYNTQFYNHNAYKRGLIILQDKASCLPVHLLNPSSGSVVLDMCAAPGMKTSHLAAALNGQGTVYAVERNEERFKTLNNIVESLDTTCIKTINKDVLKVTDEECPNVEYILVDPSCSGSGMIDRVTVDNHLAEPSSERLQKLANFQIIILKHALTHFPQAKRVVYSTCSIYSKENEYVVSEVLKIHTGFKLVSANALLNNSLKNSSEDWGMISEYCISTKPEKDLANGFFIAVFEKDESLGKSDYLIKQENRNAKKIKEDKVGYQQDIVETPKESSKNKKTRKSKRHDGLENNEEVNDNKMVLELRDNANVEQSQESVGDNLPAKKKTKKKKHKAEQINSDEEQTLHSSVSSLHEGENLVSKKRNKKKRKAKEAEFDEEVVHSEIDLLPKVKNKRKRTSKEAELHEEQTISGGDHNSFDSDKQKKSKKKKNK